MTVGAVVFVTVFVRIDCAEWVFTRDVFDILRADGFNLLVRDAKCRLNHLIATAYLHTGLALTTITRCHANRRIIAIWLTGKNLHQTTDGLRAVQR